MGADGGALPVFDGRGLQALRKQLSSLLLEDALQLSGGEFTIVWPITAFRDRYHKLLKRFGFNAREEGHKCSLAAFREACRGLFDYDARQSVGDQAAVVGSSSLYMTTRTQQWLEQKLASPHLSEEHTAEERTERRRRKQQRVVTEIVQQQESEMRDFQRQWRGQLQDMQRKHEAMLRLKTEEHWPGGSEHDTDHTLSHDSSIVPHMFLNGESQEGVTSASLRNVMSRVSFFESVDEHSPQEDSPRRMRRGGGNKDSPHRRNTAAAGRVLVVALPWRQSCQMACPTTTRRVYMQI